jgi:hypothetical protein
LNFDNQLEGLCEPLLEQIIDEYIVEHVVWNMQMMIELHIFFLKNVQITQKQERRTSNATTGK